MVLAEFGISRDAVVVVVGVRVVVVGGVISVVAVVVVLVDVSVVVVAVIAVVVGGGVVVVGVVVLVFVVVVLVAVVGVLVAVVVDVVVVMVIVFSPWSHPGYRGLSYLSTETSVAIVRDVSGLPRLIPVPCTVCVPGESTSCCSRPSGKCRVTAATAFDSTVAR